MLKKAVYKAWGPKPLLIEWIYTAIVQPRLTYCSIAWSHTLRYTIRKATINKLNRLAAPMIIPVRRSTPIKALEILYDLMPLNLYCQYESEPRSHKTYLERREPKMQNLHWPQEILDRLHARYAN